MHYRSSSSSSPSARPAVALVLHVLLLRRELADGFGQGTEFPSISLSFLSHFTPIFLHLNSIFP